MQETRSRIADMRILRMLMKTVNSISKILTVCFDMSKFFYLGRESGEVSNLKEYLAIVCVLFFAHTCRISLNVLILLLHLFSERSILLLSLTDLL